MLKLARSRRRVLIAISSILAVYMTSGVADADRTQGAAPVAGALFPVAGAKGVCPDTALRLTFNAPPILREGKIRVLDASNHSVVQSIAVSIKQAEQSIGGLPHFNYYPVVISGKDATIYLPNGSLAYNKTYDVTIDAGTFKTDGVGSAAIGGANDWRFTTKAAPPGAGSTNLTVAADGSGDFCTVQGAIDFVPAGNTIRTTIFLRKGTYSELVFFANKHALTFTGEDRKQTVISYANNAKFNPSSDRAYHRGVFLAAGCGDLVINNLTIRNTTPSGGSQAEALIINGDARSRAMIANVNLYSCQDTLQINGQAYISNCYVEGDVDFMWGNGPCFFENCHCYGTRSGAFYTQIRNPPSNHGYVYHHCTFDGPASVNGMYLSRIAPARFPNSEVVLMDCVMGPAVSPVGWQLNAVTRGDAVPTTAADLHFWEYNSHDTSGKAVDVSRRLDVSRQLKLPYDTELIANYSKPSFVLGNNWEAQSDPNLPPGTGR